jgi:hypothetical protein
LNKKKFMVLVVQYDAKNQVAAEKAVDDLRTKTAFTEVSCHYQGSDERIINAVKNNLANAEQP